MRPEAAASCPGCTAQLPAVMSSFHSSLAPSPSSLDVNHSGKIIRNSWPGMSSSRNVMAPSCAHCLGSTQWIPVAFCVCTMVSTIFQRVERFGAASPAPRYVTQSTLVRANQIRDDRTEFPADNCRMGGISIVLGGLNLRVRCAQVPRAAQ